MSLYRIESNLLLPFRSWLPPCEAKGQYMDDEWDSNIRIAYSQFTQVLTGIINTSLCTIVGVSTFIKLPIDSENAKVWARNNAAAIVADVILPRLNYLFLKLKRDYPQVIMTGCLRSVGDMDLLFSTLLFEGEGVLARTSSSVTASLGVPPPAYLMERRACPDGPVLAEPDSTRPIPQEWTIITRAVDLVNHGYFSEALLVGFALLDAMVQDFVKDRIPHLSKEDAGRLLRNMRGQRLETFLGPLLRVCINASPLEDKQMKLDMVWLNEKRNAIIHRGDQCLRKEAQHGLRTVWQILKYLAEKGANYSIPNSLEFYTPPGADFPTS